MKIGEKIKRIRLHRHMKQRELGELVGFTDGAANRIAQYESGFRVPKEDMVKKIAAALQVEECALLEPDTGNLEGIMETLFWLDEDMPDVLRLRPKDTSTNSKPVTVPWHGPCASLLSAFAIRPYGPAR